MSTPPQTAEATNEQGSALAAIASGRLQVSRSEMWHRWQWDQMLPSGSTDEVQSKAEQAEIAEKESKRDTSFSAGIHTKAGWDPSDEDVPGPVRSVIDLHARDWVTLKGKLTPLGLAVYLRWIRSATGIDVAIDRVPVQVPVPVEVPVE